MGGSLKSNSEPSLNAAVVLIMNSSLSSLTVEEAVGHEPSNLII